MSEFAISTVDPQLGLRYRGRDVRELIPSTPYERVWGLLVDGHPDGALPGAEPFPLPVRTGDDRVDMQSALAQLAPIWGFRPIVDVTSARLRDDLARASVMAISFLAQSVRGEEIPAIPQREVNTAGGIAQRFVMRWRGEVDPNEAAAINSCWVALAEHGFSPSTRAARLIASTGADAAACLSGALAAASGPRGGGAAARSLALLTETEETGDADGVVSRALANGGLYGFDEDDYLGEDPRVSGMRAVAEELRIPRLEAALALSRAGHKLLTERTQTQRPGYGSNAMFWAAVLFDYARVPPRTLTAMFACGRAAGWSAHIAEAHQEVAEVHQELE